MPRRTVIMLVQGMVISRIDYACFIYFRLPKSTLILLQRIMRQGVRVIYRLPQTDNTMLHAQELLHWLTFVRRIDFRIIYMFQKASIVNSPLYISGYLGKIYDKTRTLYYEPKIVGNHEFGIRAVKYAGPRLLN